jgi:hypothetical protein
MNRSLLFTLLVFTFSQVSAQLIPDLIDSYRADKGALERKYEIDLSQATFDRMDQFYQEWESKLATVDFEKLNQTEKIDFVLLRNLIEKNKNQHHIDLAKFAEVKDVGKGLSVLYQFTNERKWGKNPNSEKLATDLYKAEIELKKQLEEHKKAPKYNSWQKAELASKVIAELAKSSKEAYKFYDGYNPSFM